MRPKKLEYTLSAADTAGFMTTAVLTGAGPNFTTIAGAPTDGISHLVSVTSGANIATIIFTITGTDSNGNVITNTVTGVNANTVNGTKYFKTVTSVSISATLGANTASVGWTAAAATPIIPVDTYAKIGPMVSIGLDGTTVTWTAQGTNINIYNEPTTDDWFTIGTASSTTNLAVQGLAGTTAVRVLVVSHTTGTLELVVSQARV
jgi:hypothetical protein